MQRQSPNVLLAELNSTFGEVRNHSCTVEKQKDTKNLTTDDELDKLLLARFSNFDDKLTSMGTRLETIEGTVVDHLASILRIVGNLVADTNRLVHLEIFCTFTLYDRGKDQTVYQTAETSR